MTRLTNGPSSPKGEHGSEGQSLVEFALVLLPLVLVLLGIMQFGLIFNAYVTVANAAREGARAGTIFVPDANASQSSNDSNRAAYISANVNAALGFLNPAEVTTVSTYSSGSTACQGTASDPRRKNQCVNVAVTYHLTPIIPLIGDLLPRAADGKMSIPAKSQMVIN
jgi:Flp pilus assembly protein TadG